MSLSDAALQKLWARINAAVAAGQWETAFAGAEQALAAGAEHPLLYKLRAAKRDRAGDFPGAVQDFQRVRGLEPDNLAALSPLGLSLAKAGRHAEAITTLTDAVARQPADPTPLFNRGWTYESAGDLRGAERDYRAAAKLKPDHTQAWAALASILSRLGDWDGARAAAETALRLSPHDAVAQTVLAGADIKRGDHVGAEHRLRAVLRRAGSGLGLHEKAIAEGSLADALDAQGRTAEAFAVYTAANTDLRQVYAGRFNGPGSAEPAGRLAERIAAYLERAGPSPADTPYDDDPVRAHVFVLGFPRSGTTLMGQVLATHSDIVTLDEAETVSEIGHVFLSAPGGLDQLEGLSRDEIALYRRRYWALVASRAEVSGKVFVDKLPLNTLGLPVIRKLFPQARVLFMRRDPRDVILSCFRQRFGVNAGTWELLTLDGAAAFYDRTMRIGVLAEEKLGLATRNQSFERLVTHFADEVKAICAFVGVEPTEGMDRFDRQAAANAVATPSASQLAKGLNADGIGRWRAYAEPLAPVMRVLEPWVQAFGYDRGDA